MAMFSPMGFFRDTDDVLSEGKEEEEDGVDVVSLLRGGMGLEVDDAGRRRAKGDSDMVRCVTWSADGCYFTRW